MKTSDVETEVHSYPTAKKKVWPVYTLEGSGPLSKRTLVFEAIKKYINEHPTETFNDILRIFPKKLQGTYGVIIDEAEYNSRHGKSSDVERRYFIKKPLTDSVGNKIYVCSQWGDNFEQFREHVQSTLGWTIEEL